MKVNSINIVQHWRNLAAGALFDRVEPPAKDCMLPTRQANVFSIGKRRHTGRCPLTLCKPLGDEVRSSDREAPLGPTADACQSGEIIGWPLGVGLMAGFWFAGGLLALLLAIKPDLLTGEFLAAIVAISAAFASISYAILGLESLDSKSMDMRASHRRLFTVAKK